ncbi:protein unc-13 homolog isoform X3 [Ziziphus jujuba]|uniref:Protein unc-13 homolog isoform X3 n=1 Tax=Ziziphus jujuba TaxID=326968 RepID=A0ABM4ABP3_ZIZJJ|nr:protein unc-13 homolog isoform X3 [Ziziphus jujuba]
MMDEASLLQRYRHDRRKLLEFIFSSGLVKELRTSSGTTTSDYSHFLCRSDFDTLSADYILHCLNSGGVVDISEARKKYMHESTEPLMIHSQLGNSYFLVSDPDLSGSPPRRAPPPIDVKQTINQVSSSSEQMDSLYVENTATVEDNYGLKYRATTATRSKPVENVKIPSLGLPNLHTGLSDDDLRESAYEILLASMVSSGIDLHVVEDKKKERTARFLRGLKSKRDKSQTQYQYLERNSELINIIRVQMQMSEAMDACIRRRLMQLATRRMCELTDIPQISLGLLNSVFKTDFSHEKSYIHWKSRQALVLEELLCYSTNAVAPEHLTAKCSLEKIRNSKLQEWDTTMTPSERAEVLSTIKHVALKLSSLHGHVSIESENYYWTTGYHLNIRLYEKLLLGMFDVLDEGQLIEEADEFLTHIKLTWTKLGITEKIHHAIFGWVLFQQFAATDEATLLEHAIVELQKVTSAENDNEEERLYIDSLACSRECDGAEIKLSLLEAIRISISIWCDSKLQDYHLHFSQQPGNLRRVMSLVSTVGILTSDSKLTRSHVSSEDAAVILKSYVERSIEAAYGRVASTVELESKVEKKHPLAFLANELSLIVNREIKVFYPVMRQWCPESGMIVAKLLHQIYWERLSIFLNEVSCLSEDVKQVLPAAGSLDNDLRQLYATACEGNNQDLQHYPIGEIAKPIILDWVIAQHSRILEWTGRASDFEDWEPLSLQQRQAASVVEVFRIIEETVDQLFGLKLPIDITHLQALLSIIFHTLDAYLQKVLNQLVEKNHLYPSAPPLTRYTETTIPVMKTKLLESKVLDNNVLNKLDHLTISKLCVRLNTLKYIQKQMDLLEGGIRESWVRVRHYDNKNCAKEERQGTTCNEEVDELFVTTFNIIRDTSSSAIGKICEFIGARIVFWDLRDAFLSSLYRGNVADARLESVLPHVDTVLDDICGLVDDALRDLVVLSACRATLEGYAWVLLDGGPSCAFSDSDIVLMEDDLTTLKEFFVADGEGLPRSLVEQEAKVVEQILGLYSLQTESVIQMLMTASEQISLGLDSHEHGRMNLINVHTLIRILCHKKDREASKFLKRHYQLPMSSDYEDTSSRDSTPRSPYVSDFMKRSTSFRWNTKGQTSFKSFKKRLQEATSEIRNVGW